MKMSTALPADPSCTPAPLRARAPLPRDLRSRLSRLAHAAGAQPELEVRARLQAELAALVAGGADRERLVEHLEAAERAVDAPALPTR